MRNLKGLDAQRAKWKLLAVTLSVLIMLCTQAGYAFALELRIRNDFEKKMQVSVVYFDSAFQRWRTAGWFVADPRSESRVILNTLKIDVYIYAELLGASTTWGNGDIIRMVVAEPFSYFDWEECPPGRNRRNVRFTKYEARSGVLIFRPKSSATGTPLRKIEETRQPPTRTQQPSARTQQPLARTQYNNAQSRVDHSVELLNLINSARRKAGVPDLRLNESMSRAASRRASELTIRYAHDRPDGRKCHTVFAEFGFAPRISGENVAWRSGWNNTSMEAFNKAFINSPAHRANMLNQRFTTIGLGFARHGNRLYVAELFAGN